MDLLVNEGRLAEVLLVEDNPLDVELTVEAFSDARLAVNLHHVEDGEACLAFLRKQGEYADRPTPDLILLDMNMPRLNGREVLAEIVKDEALRSLPVVVLTTSSNEKDILDMYNLRCSSYLVKPVDFDKFKQVIQQLQEHWFSLVVLPRRHAQPNSPQA